MGRNFNAKETKMDSTKTLTHYDDEIEASVLKEFLSDIPDNAVVKVTNDIYGMFQLQVKREH